MPIWLSAVRRLAAGCLLLSLLAACAAPPAAPIESTQPATEAPVSEAEQTAQAAEETAAPELGTPEGYPTEVIAAVVNDQLVLTLLSALEHRGLPPTLLDASRVPMLSDAPGQGYRLGEGWLNIHVYPDVAAAEAAAARLPADMANSLIDWVAPPHLFGCDRLIVMYFGVDANALQALTELCGPPFYTTELPEPTVPAPVTDYRVVTRPDVGRQLLDETLLPTDLHGSEYAAIGMDGEVYVVDWSTGTKTQVTTDGLFKAEAVLSQSYVAWTANAGEPGSGTPPVHIHVLNRSTGEQRVITEQPAPRMQLTLDGSRLAWADKRNELDGHYTAYDIYAYDLAADAELAVAVALGAQHQPSLSGALLVWADNRDSAQRDTDLAGCGNCPANRFDLYLYDFAAQTTRVLVSGAALRQGPAVDGQRVAWTEISTVEAALGQGMAIGAGDVYWMDLKTEAIHRATDTPQPETAAALSGDRLQWTVRQDCDVLSGPVGATPEPPMTGVYVFNLGTGAVARLTDYVEPRALVAGGAVLVVEGCMAGREVYVVSVD